MKKLLFIFLCFIFTELAIAQTPVTTRRVKTDTLTSLSGHGIDVKDTIKNTTGQIVLHGWLKADSGATISGAINWAGGSVIYVPLNGDLQTAIDNADAGSTLILASGVYTITSTIEIDKQLNIIGQGHAGFATTPITPSHGTLISSDTEDLITFYITNDNIRISDLSINATGSGNIGISTSKNLQGIVLSTIDVIVDDNGIQRGIDVYSSDVIIRDVTFYVRSNNNLATGVRLYNDDSSTKDAIVDCYNVTGITVGALTSAYAFVCDNQNDANTVTINLSSCIGTVTAGTDLDIAVGSISTTTSNATVTTYMCTFSGADYDAYQTESNVLNIGGSVLVNNKVSGIITYRSALASATGVFSIGMSTPRLSNLTGNGFVITSGDNGTLSIDSLSIDNLNARADSIIANFMAKNDSIYIYQEIEKVNARIDSILANPPSGSAFAWNVSGESQVEDSIRFIAGSNVTLTQSGNTMTIAATAAEEGLFEYNGDGDLQPTVAGTTDTYFELDIEENIRPKL